MVVQLTTTGNLGGERVLFAKKEKENEFHFGKCWLWEFVLNIHEDVWNLSFSHSVTSNSLWPHGLQHTRLPCLLPSTGVCLNLCPLNHWSSPIISSSVIPFSSCLPSFPASGSFLMSQLFSSGGQNIGASGSASVLPMSSQAWFLLGLGWSPCNPMDSQESSPTPQFKSINSSLLSLLYSTPLTSIHDYWKNHSFDSMDLCWQSNVSAF